MKRIASGLFLALFIFTMSSCKKDKNQASQSPNVEDQKSEVTENSTGEVEREEEITYTIAAEMPRFPGCEDPELKTIEKYLCSNKRLNNYVSNRLRYPKLALNNRVEGTVIAKFVVRPDGLIDDIQVQNDIGYGCGKTVLGIIESMNHMNERWIPGKQSGVPVRVQMSLPVEFRLMIDEDEK